ncbi:alpha/beta hydrolase [Geitlerinema sp. P-1104]|uniref:alpha/beta fold hydrolase n=1 Tax=Geitlerinema sp. P-1104 TaxID=2546230 RepID=UPI001476EF55|nr:alpha/beta hydrolase [Geitlerinema sp. P-1104]NMG60517.1 alpha/beta hydrolase [Geitlerinema sp. P-1104]
MSTTAPNLNPIEALPSQTYHWENYQCAYAIQHPPQAQGIPLLLIHPIGVGLSRHFWQRFCQEWQRQGQTNPLYLPDLLGCGESEMPRIAYRPEDWSNQLYYFLKTVIQQPVIVVVQGALAAVALRLAQQAPDHVAGLVLSGPPAWEVMTRASDPSQSKLIWNLFFDTPLGWAFYRYARREAFLRSFSQDKLFAQAEDVDANWLDTLQQGAADVASRHAVFSFLAGFWRQDYGPAIRQLQQPVQVLFGEAASGISKRGKNDPAPKRLQDYLSQFPNAQGTLISGRNVMPYEEPEAFVRETARFVQQQQSH